MKRHPCSVFIVSMFVWASCVENANNIKCFTEPCFIHFLRAFSNSMGTPDVVYYCGSGFQHGIAAKIYPDSFRGRLFIGCGRDKIKTYSISIPRHLVPGRKFYHWYKENQTLCNTMSLNVDDRIVNQQSLTTAQLKLIAKFRLYVDSVFHATPEFWMSEQVFQSEEAKRTDIEYYDY